MKNKYNLSTESGQQKIRAELENVQKRCTARTVTLEEIQESVEHIEKTLNIPKKTMKGIVYNVDLNAQHFPSAYKYTPDSTAFYAEYTGTHWIISNIRRTPTAAPTHKYTAIELPEETREALCNRFKAFI